MEEKARVANALQTRIETDGLSVLEERIQENHEQTRKFEQATRNDYHRRVGFNPFNSAVLSQLRSTTPFYEVILAILKQQDEKIKRLEVIVDSLNRAS